MAFSARGSALETSKTQQVALLLRDAIAAGDFAPGDKLPGEMRLAAHYGVSRVTVRRALAELESAGLICRRSGAGTIVLGRSLNEAPISADISNMLSHISAMGRESTVRLLACDYTPGSEELRRGLHLAEGERLQRSVRVRLLEGDPFSHLTTHVPATIASTYSEAELATQPLLTLLERSGVVVDHAEQTISATLATPEVAAALTIQVGAPLLAVTRLVFDGRGRGVEHLAALYRPDRYRLAMRLARVTNSDGGHWETVS